MTGRTTRPTRLTARDLMRESELVIPLGMSVGAAAAALEAAEIEIAPVVDSRGRCVGVFTADDYQRWLDRSDPKPELVPGRSRVNGPTRADEVRYHITGQFTAVMPDTGVQELRHRLDGTEDQFLVVLDRQARPRGVVCARDLLVTKSNTARVGSQFALAG
jgi:CBS-domain-containing membrane protein